MWRVQNVTTLDIRWLQEKKEIWPSPLVVKTSKNCASRFTVGYFLSL
jgi:hypothetical protein